MQLSATGAAVGFVSCAAGPPPSSHTPAHLLGARDRFGDRLERLTVCRRRLPFDARRVSRPVPEGSAFFPARTYGEPSPAEAPEEEPPGGEYEFHEPPNRESRRGSMGRGKGRPLKYVWRYMNYWIPVGKRAGSFSIWSVVKLTFYFS